MLASVGADESKERFEAKLKKIPKSEAVTNCKLADGDQRGRRLRRPSAFQGAGLSYPDG
jgi:hypothetical protein